jgi:hypothetical protein
MKNCKFQNVVSLQLINTVHTIPFHNITFHTTIQADPTNLQNFIRIRDGHENAALKCSDLTWNDPKSTPRLTSRGKTNARVCTLRVLNLMASTV